MADLRDLPFIEFNNGYAMEVRYDKRMKNYTVSNPISKTESTKLAVILQCETIEFARSKFIETVNLPSVLSKLENF